MLEEFPPPRLAVSAALKEDASRLVLSQKSRAQVRLRRGRQRTAWTELGLVGWMEGGGPPTSGQLRVDTSQAAGTPESRAVRKLGELDIRWSTSPQEAALDADDGVRTQLELNHHRSELLLGLRRTRNAAGETVSVRTQHPVRISLPDHALDLAFDAGEGRRLQATHIDLQFEADVEPE